VKEEDVENGESGGEQGFGEAFRFNRKKVAVSEPARGAKNDE